jgi:hypothetical protein
MMGTNVNSPLQYTSVSPFTGTKAVTTTPANIIMGFCPEQQYTGNYLSEAIYFQETHTDQQADVIEAYLAWKWGFQTAAGGVLPSSNPYSGTSSLKTITPEESAATASMAIASGQRASAAIASGQIASAAIASAAIASGQIASAAIASAQIASGQQASAQIASGQQASAQIASGQQASAQIVSGQRASAAFASGQQYSGAFASGQQASGQQASSALGVKSLGQDPGSGKFLLRLQPL